MKSRILFAWTFFLFVFSMQAESQEIVKQIRLLDNSTLHPITDVHYHIGNQQGISDAEGLITFKPQQDDTLFLSHVSYGNWLLTGALLNEAILEGTIFKDKEIMSSSPITVIALRPVKLKSEHLGLKSQDKLAQDGGAILLQSTASVSGIRKSGSYGFDPVLRGFKYEQLNIVIDGAHSAVAACPNRMDPPSSQIAPNMVDHIEILKGPHSFRFGTSFGGTINFQSTPLRFNHKQRLYARQSSSFESNGRVLRSETVTGIHNTSYDLGLFGSFSKSGDYEDGSDKSISSSFERTSLGSNLGIRLSSSQKLKISATFNRAKDTDFPALPMDLRSDETYLFNIQHLYEFGDDRTASWQTIAYGSFVDHIMDNLDKTLSPRKLNAKTTANTKSLGFRSEASWNMAGGRMYSGIDLKHESGDGERSRAFLIGPMAGKTVYDNVWNGGQITKTGLFSEYHYNLKKVRLIASGRLEYNSSETTSPDPLFIEKNPVLDNNQWNPNISFGGISSITEKISLGAWIGRASRSPGLTERFINSFPVGLDAYDLLGDPELESESNNQIDLSLSYHDEATKFDLNIFASSLNNYISSVVDTALTPAMPSSPGVRRFFNINKAIMSGFEVSLKQKLTGHFEHHLSLAYTYGQNRTNNEPLPEIAPLDLVYSLYGTYFNDNLLPQITYRYVHKQDRISGSYNETRTPSFSLLDAFVSYRMGKNFSARLGIQNLFDKAYYEHLSRSNREDIRPIYNPGRNFLFSFSIDLM